MKLIKFIVIPLLIIIGLGYGGYQLLTNYLSDQIVSTVTENIENFGPLDDVKTIIDSNNELKNFVEDGAAVSEDVLAFTSLSEAADVIIDEMGITGLLNIREVFENGIDSFSAEQLLTSIDNHLSDEQMLALKVLLYKEVYGQ